MSRSNDKEVSQASVAASGGRIVHLNFKSYHQSQGGVYECRVTGPGNNTERLSVCIRECYTFLLTVKPATYDSGLFLVPSIIHNFVSAHHVYTQ